MKKFILPLLIGTLLVFPARAEDSWRGHDKRLHAQFSCYSALGTTAIFPDQKWYYQLGISQIPGVLRETYTHISAGSRWSWKDIGANLIGGSLCLPIGNWIMQPQIKNNMVAVTLTITLD